jgi:hypothetical protein
MVGDARIHRGDVQSVDLYLTDISPKSEPRIPGPIRTMPCKWVADLGGCWEEITFQETRDSGFLLGRLEDLWWRVPRYKPLSVGVVLLDLIHARHPASARSLRAR